VIDRQRWYPRRHIFHQEISAELASWLFDTSSLTARLVAMCGKRFNVRLLSQRWQKIDPEEAAAMRLGHVRSALVRQVLLCCGDIPLVYARSVIPSVTVSGAQRRYANMGRRPLGAMLFSDRTMRREQVMVSRLPTAHKSIREFVNTRNDAAQGDGNSPVSSDAIWGRRSVFRVSGKPLLVSEFFLPALFDVSSLANE